MMEAYLTEGKLKTTIAQITSEQGISRRHSVFFCPLIFSEITEHSPPYSPPLPHSNLKDTLIDHDGGGL